MTYTLFKSQTLATVLSHRNVSIVNDGSVGNGKNIPIIALVRVAH